MRLALIAFLLPLAGCAAFSEDPTDAPERSGKAGVTVGLPPGWHSLTPVRDAHVIDPLPRVVVSSAPIEEAGTGCQVADFAPRADAVSLIVLEWQRDDARPPPRRPDRFTEQTLRLYPPPAIECFDGSGGTAFFEERGRHFGAYVLLGRDAPDTLAAQARAVLDTLRVSAPPN